MAKIFHSVVCTLGSLVGDGFCNDESNNADCNYDGGDCCGYCVIKEYCSACECHHNANSSGSMTSNPLVGNGICNDETNNPECLFDGQECCGIAAITSNCLECECKGKLLFLKSTFPFNLVNSILKVRKSVFKNTNTYKDWNMETKRVWHDWSGRKLRKLWTLKSF